MDIGKLKRANELKKEIQELDSFIFYASKVWTGKLTIKEKVMSFISNAYGAFESKEFKMDTHIKNRVLDVLIDYKNELEKEFEDM